MKEKFSMMVFGIFLVFGLFLTGCASLNNLFNPIYAINNSGEKLKATLGSGQTVKINEAEYQYKARPMVPAAPQKPNEPSKPVKPAAHGKFEYSYQDNRGSPLVGVLTWNNDKELQNLVNYYRNYANSINPNERQFYAGLLQTYNNVMSIVSGYEDSVRKYQSALSKYQQDIANYESAKREYDAMLPQYTARVSAEIKAIQDAINPNLPNNWDRYVEGQFLLYKGK